eukprot:4504947-Lingulodinium_polyedra.AAC.1
MGISWGQMYTRKGFVCRDLGHYVLIWVAARQPAFNWMVRQSACAGCRWTVTIGVAPDLQTYPSVLSFARA